MAPRSGGSGSPCNWASFARALSRPSRACSPIMSRSSIGIARSRAIPIVASATQGCLGFELIAAVDQEEAEQQQGEIETRHDRDAEPDRCIRLADEAGAEPVDHVEERVEMGDGAHDRW